MKPKFALSLLSLLSSIFAVLLVLYGAEAVFQLQAHLQKPPINGWDDKGNLYTWGYLVTGSTFVHKKPGQPDFIRGYRQKPFSYTKPSGQYRIMVLGDSYTFGEGIAQEDRYVNRLEDLLKEANPGRDIQVINFGLRGADTVLEKFILETSIDAVQPNLIAIGFCSNDPKQKGDEYSVERERFYDQHGHILDAISSGLSEAGLPLVSQRFKLMIEHALPLFRIAPDWDTRIRNAYDKKGQEWAEFVQALAGIKKISDQKHLATPYFVVLNASLDVAENARYHQAEEAAKEVGFRTLNVESEIRSDLIGQPLSAPWGGHASKELNEVYAKKLFASINSDVRRHFK